MNTLGKLNRRQLLKALSITAAGGGTGLGTMLAARRGRAQTPEKKPKNLIVIAAGGGASIIDSFLAIPAGMSNNAAAINTFPDSAVTTYNDSPLRAVDLSGNEAGQIPISWSSNQSNFVSKHKQDIMVVTCTGTSVNHNVAQRRSITGNEAWNGRTLQEVVANEYGASYALPNVNMAGQGFIERGTDDSLPDFAFHEPVANASVWAVGLDGAAGIKDLPDKTLIERARALRNDKLDPTSPFYRTFEKSENMQLWLKQRKQSLERLEGAELVQKLLFLENSQQVPLDEYGLTPSADAALVRERFPRFASDPFEAQAALAYLLLKNRVSNAVTLGPSFNVVLDGLDEIYNPPLAYDYSHNAHRAAQAIMWSRMLNAADGLIDLLKNIENEPGSGESMWDHSLIYIATEFGREKGRPNNANEWGTGHNLNNGFVVISPLVNGNTVLGGVDPDTGLTYGFDPVTGDPRPNEEMAERHVFAGILQALGVDTSSVDTERVPNMPAMVRS